MSSWVYSIYISTDTVRIKYHEVLPDTTQTAPAKAIMNTRGWVPGGVSSLGLTQSSKTHTPIHTQFRNSPITLDSNLLNTFLLTRHICLSLHSPQLPVPEHLKKSPITERCLSYFSRYHCLNLKLHSAFCPYGIFSNSLFLTLWYPTIFSQMIFQLLPSHLLLGEKQTV